MAARLSSQTAELTALAAELSGLNVRRDTVMRRIQTLVAAMVADGTTPVGRSARNPRRRRHLGRPKGFKVSTATRAKLRAAWKRRRAATG